MFVIQLHNIITSNCADLAALECVNFTWMANSRATKWFKIKFNVLDLANLHGSIREVR